MPLVPRSQKTDDSDLTADKVYIILGESNPTYWTMDKFLAAAMTSFWLGSAISWMPLLGTSR